MKMIDMFMYLLISCMNRCLAFKSISLKVSSILKESKDDFSYEIDVHEMHPKVAETALKHCNTWDTFASKHILSRHSVVAYQQAVEFVDGFYDGSPSPDKSTGPKPVILDSGCGVGLSSMWIALENPAIPVIGIDRSFVRLAKSIHSNSFTRGSTGNLLDALRDSLTDSEMIDEKYDDVQVADENAILQKTFLRGKRPKNLFLVRAELTDFWMLVARQSDWLVAKHYLLYPNPYPKSKHLQRRWHGMFQNIWIDQHKIIANSWSWVVVTQVIHRFRCCLGWEAILRSEATGKFIAKRWFLLCDQFSMHKLCQASLHKFPILTLSTSTTLSPILKENSFYLSRNCLR